MPVYTYRREDGSTFDYRQKFNDDPLTVDPETGQAVQRVIQPAGIVFKGAGFYINDSKASKSSFNGNGSAPKADPDSSKTTSSSSEGTKSEAAAD